MSRQDDADELLVGLAVVTDEAKALAEKMYWTGIRAALEAVNQGSDPSLGDDGTRWQAFFADRIESLLEEDGKGRGSG